ncbi:MAG TPA: M20 family metallopeptidase [Pyrinomonadaceae bacterium]|nr:M20 family metallopeptidase [Pyrinomonadaceae bacterium]
MTVPAQNIEFDRHAAERLLEHFARREDDVVSLARALVERESPSGDLEGSRAVVDLLEAALRETGAVSDQARVVSEGYGEHLRVEAFGSANGDARPLLLLGHTDTVHARGSLEQRPWREEEGRLYGPGVFDMKANCALAVEALSACAGLGLKPARPVILLLTCDEEAGSRTGRALVEREAARAECVLVLEPSAPGGAAKTGRKGTGIFTLRAEGRAAHAGLDPEKGASAVLEIARQIERMHALNDLPRGVTVNVGVVAGGTRSNVVAAEATAEIDLRFETNEDGARLEAALLNPRPFDERVRLLAEGGVNRPPLERTAEVLKLYDHARGLASVLGFDLGETKVGGASDGNFAAALCPRVLDGLGVEGGGAHAVDEHILRRDVARRGALIAALVATL